MIGFLPLPLLLLAVSVQHAPADTLRLGPGIHVGPLVLDRPTVLLAQPGAVLRGSGTGTVLTIRARGTVVRGLRVEHSGRNTDRDDAGVMVLADSVILEDLKLRDVLFGVYLRKARGVTLRRVDIEGPRGLPESQTGNGIHLHYSRGITIDSCRIAWVRDGIYFEYTDSATVIRNHIDHSRFGLHYMFSHFNHFRRNVFTHNAAGAVVMNSNGLVIEDNVFAWNTGGRSFGLVLQTATEPKVIGNLFVGNGTGTFFDNVIRGRYSDNLVAENWLGLQLFSNSEQTQVIGNAIVGNTFEASGGSTEGAYILCAGGRGNYWGSTAGDGFDLDGDGVLDQPHGASSPLTELARSREALRLFLGSPAARTLEWAERTFPVFELDQAKDSCPAARPPVIAAVTELIPREANERGSFQYAAAVASLAAGLGILAVPSRWRHRLGKKEPRA